MIDDDPRACHVILQVPLGTVVHKLVPPEIAQKEEEEPFTFQQHWVGARDYVSSDEEPENEDAAMRQNKDADLEVTHLELSACLAPDAMNCHPGCCKTPNAISTVAYTMYCWFQQNPF